MCRSWYYMVTPTREHLVKRAQNNQVGEMTQSTDVNQPPSASFCQWCPGTECITALLFTAKHTACRQRCSSRPSPQVGLSTAQQADYNPQSSGLQPGCTTASPGQLLKDTGPAYPRLNVGPLGAQRLPGNTDAGGRKGLLLASLGKSR